VTRILILEKFADTYERELARQFAGIEIHKAATAADHRDRSRNHRRAGGIRNRDQ